MTDEELLNGLRGEMLANEDKDFVDSVHEKALAYVNEPPVDLYHRYMEVASAMRASGRGEFAGLVESQREANAQLRRVWIAWLVAAYEHEIGRLGELNF